MSRIIYQKIFPWLYAKLDNIIAAQNVYSLNYFQTVVELTVPYVELESAPKTQ